jgi:hypothetical protein
MIILSSKDQIVNKKKLKSPIETALWSIMNSFKSWMVIKISSFEIR